MAWKDKFGCELIAKDLVRRPPREFGSVSIVFRREIKNYVGDLVTCREPLSAGTIIPVDDNASFSGDFERISSLVFPQRLIVSKDSAAREHPYRFHEGLKRPLNLLGSQMAR